MAVDLNNPATYSGVPQGSYSPGQVITTGLAGTSRVSDYGGQPIYSATTGAQLTNPAYIIPAGAQISIGAPPVGGGNVVTGTGITDQGIQKEGVEGTLANNAQANANTLAIAQAQIQAQAQAQAQALAVAQAQLQQQAQVANQQFAEAQANYALQAAQAQQQYQLDAANFGLSKAQDLYQQRVGQAQLVLQRSQAELANANFSLQQNQFNAQQAQAKESARENILNMLNSRTGPQDYVAYNNLLNGLNAPNPDKSTTVDPFAGLDALYQPSNITPPAVPEIGNVSDEGAINAIQMPGQVNIPAFPSNPATGGASINYTPGAAPTINAPTITGTPAAVGTNPSGPYGNPTATNPPQPSGQVPYGSLASYISAPGSTGTMSDGTAYTNANTGPVNTPKPYQYNIGGLADGGDASQPPMAIVGEGHGQHPSNNAEIAMALVDRLTGRPVLHVMNAEQARPIIDQQSIPRAASGGTYGTALNNQTVTTNLYSPGELGSLPFYQKLTGQSPNRPYGGFGATVSNPAQGIYNAPTAINMQNYNQLLPSEQSMFTSLYGQGLSLNPDDILAMARNAAPTTKQATANVYGG